MADYKRAEDIIKAFAMWTEYAPEIEKIVKAIPSADVVEVVRCRDCIHNVGVRDGVPFWDEDITCDYWESDGLQGYDYCIQGERSDK